MLQVKIDDHGSLALARQILGDYPKALHRCFRNSIVDAAKAARAEANRQVLARYDIKRQTLKEFTHVKIVTPKASNGGQGDTGGVIISGTRIPTMKFNMLPVSPPFQAGIAVKDRQLVSTIVVRGAATVGKPNRFVARMKSGHIGLFRRTGEGKKIDEEFRVSVAEMIAGKNIAPKIQKRTSEVLQDRVLKNTERELRELNGKSHK